MAFVNMLNCELEVIKEKSAFLTVCVNFRMMVKEILHKILKMFVETCKNT
jgi:hypothetical protein